MLILGIETATSTCATAFWQEGVLLGEIRFKQKKMHAEILSGMVEKMMAQCQVDYKNIDGIAISIGPGSFTGLRIGMAMAKGIAFAQNLDVVGIHTPDAIASSIFPDETEIIVVMPSRKGEVYAAKYISLDASYQRVGRIVSIEITQLTDWADSAKLVAGPGMHTLMSAGLSQFTFLPERYWEISAAPVARLGARRLLAEGADDLTALEPAYIKSFQTTMAVGA